MKFVYFILFLMLPLSAFTNSNLDFSEAESYEASSFDRQVKVRAKDHTCQELNDLIHQHGSIWLKAFLGYDNVSLYGPKCSGAHSHPDRVCRYFTRRVRAKDGRCRLAGESCSCHIDHDDDD